MATKTSSRVKHNGVYYTPIELARFLAKPLIRAADLTVFDPAYGGGALLLAAEQIFNEKGYSPSYAIELYGCDKIPQNGFLKHLQGHHLLKLDFFKYPLDKKFDVILMNPPYVRHHIMSDRRRMECKKIVDEIHGLKSTSDLWAYFLIKAVNHLNQGGNLGVILPWSFLQAEYARDIRKWLAERFENIQVLALGSHYFDNAQERTMLVWLKGFGQPVRSIKISFSQHLPEGLRYRDLKRDSWESEEVLYSAAHDIDAIVRQYIEEYDFRRFEEFADIRIGVVTGADIFFILDVDAAREGGFLHKHLIPIFTSSREFSGLSLNGNKPLKRLLSLNRRQYDHYKNYIRKGIKGKYHLRSHSLRREPWYSVISGQTPDAFFPYRASYIPYLVMNDQDAQCTNSIHRIYFKKLSHEERKWIQISLLSVPGQLSLEAYSKTYGQGILKIEPKALKRAIVSVGDADNVGPVYDKISELISQNNRVQAMEVATEFVNQKLGIATQVSDSACSALIELQERRRAPIQR
jgi:adenine-specific DNA-methyltransferase